MPIVSFSFDKIFVEKKRPIGAPLKIDTGVKIVNIQEEDASIVGKKEKVLKFMFEFDVLYQEDQAQIHLEGNLLYHEEQEKLEEVMKKWKKTKKLAPGVTQLVLNNVLFRCNIKALLLGQEMALPPHIQLPVVTPRVRKTSPKGEYLG